MEYNGCSTLDQQIESVQESNGNSARVLANQNANQTQHQFKVKALGRPWCSPNNQQKMLQYEREERGRQKLPFDKSQN